MNTAEKMTALLHEHEVEVEALKVKYQPFSRPLDVIRWRKYRSEKQRLQRQLEQRVNNILESKAE